MKKFKSKLDYILYTIIIKKKQVVEIVLDISLFLLVTSYNLPKMFENKLEILPIIINILSFIRMFWYLINAVKKIKTIWFGGLAYSITEITKCKYPKRVLPDDDYVVSIQGKNVFHRSKYVDDKLTLLDNENKKIAIYFSDQKKNKLRVCIQKNDEIMLAILRKQIIDMANTKFPLVNELKYSLGDEISFDKPIPICKSSYYDYILSNKLSGEKIYLNSNGNEDVIFDGNNIFPKYSNFEDAEVLESYAKSCLCDNIGASVLAITKDRFVVILVQGETLVDKGKYVPTGNGSGDWVDIKKSNYNLLQGIKNTMSRELFEEALKDIKDIIWLRVIGFYKWIEMGGKPQFVGLARLNIQYKDLDVKEGLKKPHKISKRKYIKVNSISELKERITELQSLPNLNASMAYLCIRILELIEDKSNIIKEWIS